MSSYDRKFFSGFRNLKKKRFCCFFHLFCRKKLRYESQNIIKLLSSNKTNDTFVQMAMSTTGTIVMLCFLWFLWVVIIAFVIGYFIMGCRVKHLLQCFVSWISVFCCKKKIKKNQKNQNQNQNKKNKKKTKKCNKTHQKTKQTNNRSMLAQFKFLGFYSIWCNVAQHIILAKIENMQTHWIITKQVYVTKEWWNYKPLKNKNGNNNNQTKSSKLKLKWKLERVLLCAFVFALCALYVLCVCYYVCWLAKWTL